MTARCTDRSFELLLYPYQLGMLSAEEARRVELHILECEACYDRVTQFEAAAEMLRHDAGVQQEMQTLAAVEADRQAAPSQPAPATNIEKRRWPLWSRVALAAAAAVLVMIAIPWQLRITTDQTVAQEPRLAVAYFKDLSSAAETDSLCQLMANLIATDLSQSRYLQVVPESRMSTVLLQQGSQPICGTGDSATAAAARTLGAKWLVTGTILQTQPSLALAVTVIDPADGRVVGTRRIESADQKDVFSAVDRITTAVKSLLPLPEAARAEADRKIADVTTHSEEAYRCYLEGVELTRKFYAEEAMEKFRRAVAIDTSFAMAYYYLARYQNISYLAKAAYYSSASTEKEQLYIKGLEAQAAGNLGEAVDTLMYLLKRYPDEMDAAFLLGQYFATLDIPSKSLHYYRIGLQLDPYFKLAHCYMAYAYSRMGLIDSALMEADKYIEAAPDEPNPYDTKGDILAINGRFAEAIAAYRQSVAIRPSFSRYASLEKIGQLSIYMGLYKQADSVFDFMIGVPSAPVQSTGRYCKAAALTQRGEFTRALALLDSGITIDQQMRDFDGVVTKRAARAFIDWEIGRSREAVAEMRHCVEIQRATEPRDPVGYRHYLVWLLAESGDTASALALADTLNQELDTKGCTIPNCQFGRAVIALVRGQIDSAAAFLQNSTNSLESNVPSTFLLGRTLLDGRRYAEAARALETARTRFQTWRIHLITWNSLIEYYLGMAYEGSGRTAEAMTEYQSFIERMQHADPPPVALADATRRLQKLQNRP